MRSSRELDPVVRAYITSDDGFREILSRSGGSESPILEALTLLQEFINGNESANGAFLAAKNLIAQGYDSDLYLLFLISWAHAVFVQSATIREKLDEAWTLLHKAKTLISAETPPEIAAYATMVEGLLVGSTGDRTTQEELMRASLALIKPSSPRRKFILLELASVLAHAGRLNDIRGEIERLSSQYSPNFKPELVNGAAFINAVETGQSHLAHELIKQLQSSVAGNAQSRVIGKYQLLQGLFDLPAQTITADSEPPEMNSELPDWGLAIHCMLTGRVHQALKWARICEKKSETFPTSAELISFNLLRAELAEGNSEAARRIMSIREERGNTHYLDDLFLCRLALLTGDKDRASEHFAALLSSVDHYGAEGRLNFELRLSPDIHRDDLLTLTRRAEKTASTRKAKPARKELQPARESGSEGTDRIISSNLQMAEIKATIQQFAPLDVPVLITGETGTGKELVAKALHEAGPRNSKPFVAINCGAISESLLESELFGHTKGAFSGAATDHQGLFEEAGDGTIFLDEIGEITPRLQIVLLRVLETMEIRPVGSTQSRKVSCRIVASTNADLQTLEKTRKFRSDLIYRLRRLEIHLPALRERKDEILVLASHFLNQGRAADVSASISQGLARKFTVYDWPGNVRELRNSVERMRLMNSDKLFYDIDDIELSPEVQLSAITPLPVRILPDTPLRAQPLQRSTPEGTLITGRSRVRRLSRLKELFTEHRILTRNEVAQTLAVSPNTATSDLRELCSEGFIEKVQPTASPRSAYFQVVTDPEGA